MTAILNTTLYMHMVNQCSLRVRSESSLHQHWIDIFHHLLVYLCKMLMLYVHFKEHVHRTNLLEYLCCLLLLHESFLNSIYYYLEIIKIQFEYLFSSGLFQFRITSLLLSVSISKQLLLFWIDKLEIERDLCNLLHFRKLDISVSGMPTCLSPKNSIWFSLLDHRWNEISNSFALN